ncbi:MAG: hypothetical protein ACFFG0_04315 [Candidatus Thorarchaeota archaeon]
MNKLPKEYWKEIIKKQQDSGKNIEEWCLENKIPLSTFHRWKTKLGFSTLRIQNPQSPKYWEEIIKKQQDSGKNIKEWCLENKIALPTFHRWKTKLGFSTLRIQNPQSPKYWEEIIKKQQDSGKSIIEWCFENKINRRYFHKWKTAFNAWEPTITKNETKSSFVELTDEDKKTLLKTYKKSNISIEHGDIRINLPEDFDDELFIKCIKLLQHK